MTLSLRVVTARVRYNPEMAWIWAALPTAIIVATTSAGHLPVGIVGYHLLCMVVVLTRARRVKSLFTWS